MPLMTKATGPEKVAWSIDHQPVLMEWDSCSMIAPGGFDRLTGKVNAKQHRRVLKQGARVKGVRPNGKTLYLGTLVSQPKIVNDVATIEAEGYSAIARRRTRRLPYIIADASQWSNVDELPFDYTNNSKYSLQSKGDGIGWIIDSAHTYNSPDRAGYGLYVPGHAIQRIRATIRKTNDDNNFDLEVRDADDLGSASVASTKTLGAATADGATWNVPAVNQNTVLINVVSNSGGGAAGTTMRVTLQDLVACVLADDNDWTTADVVADVADRLGFAADITNTDTEIEALDWTGSWDELLTYMAAIEDYTWLITEDQTKGAKKDAMLTFRPWGAKTWQTNLDMSQESLTVAPLYNRVAVDYERPEGVPQHAVFEVADFDDLTDPITNLTYEYPDAPRLENPQRSKHLVNAIGEKLLRHVSTYRLVGNIKVAALRKGTPWDIRAGDKLQVDGYDPKVPPQRIAAVTYNADGTADASLSRSFDIAAMLFRLTAHRRRSNPHPGASGHRA